MCLLWDSVYFHFAFISMWSLEFMLLCILIFKCWHSRMSASALAHTCIYIKINNNKIVILIVACETIRLNEKKNEINFPTCIFGGIDYKRTPTAHIFEKWAENTVVITINQTAFGLLFRLGQFILRILGKWLCKNKFVLLIFLSLCLYFPSVLISFVLRLHRPVLCCVFFYFCSCLRAIEFRMTKEKLEHLKRFRLVNSIVF